MNDKHKPGAELANEIYRFALMISTESLPEGYLQEIVPKQHADPNWTIHWKPTGEHESAFLQELNRLRALYPQIDWSAVQPHEGLRSI
jgi:hypothetical protein